MWTHYPRKKHQNDNSICGYHLVLRRVEWAVPDELLSLSSQTLSDNGIPCVPPSEGLTGIYGQWERAGFVHSLDPVRSHRIFFYPLSLIDLTLQDTVEVTSTFDHTLRILTPKPRIYMQQVWYHVHNDLLGFISFYILHDTPLNTKDGKLEDDESEEDFQKRVEEAVQDRRSWD
ncbi:hypothetical protein N7501_010828 [Penicillium viridicatum]|nr:hypothetical protein N7501_010828 [Penicillium viridicatum]